MPVSRYPRGLRGFGTALLLVVAAGAMTAAAPRVAGASRAPRSATIDSVLYYSLYAAGPNDVRKVRITYNGSNTLTFGTPQTVASIGSADGLVFTPVGDLIVGGGDVYMVNPRTGEKTSVKAGSSAAEHIALDPSFQKAWTSDQPGPLVEVPLNPFADGIEHPLTGDDIFVTGIAFDGAGNAYYSNAGQGDSGSFGRINLTTFVTQRAATNIPAAHGISFDTFTNSLIMVGSEQIVQVNPANMQIVSTLNLTNSGVSLDQGSVDGQGHLMATDPNGGNLVFVDYAATGLVGDNRNFRTVKFLETGLDDCAPLFGLGAPRNPDPPSDLMAHTVSVTEIDLAWTDRSNNEKGFELQRKTGSGDFATIANPGLNATSYIDNSVTPNNEYTYQVRAVNGVGESSYSNQASASTSQPPVAPTVLSASSISGNSSGLHLAWNDNSNNETGFKIERSTGGGPFTQLATTAAANAQEFTDSGLLPSTGYNYRIRATNLAGDSDYSNTSTATTVPAAPTALTVTAPTASTLQLGWTDNSPDETGFVVERKTTGAYTALPTRPAHAGTGVVTFTDTGLASNTKYTYRVHASSAQGDSATSAEAFATTLLPGKISVTPPTVKLLNVKLNTTKGAKVTIKNLGLGPLHVTIPAAVGPFTVAPNAAQTIAPKKSLAITVSYKPTSKTAVNGSLVITSDDPTKPSSTVSISGSGK